jgi:pyruvate formate lyase activating enzyme
MTRGTILHLQRLSTEDGPGLRTTVFFKGCPLRCEWCHNPESLSRALETQWFAVRCLGCLTCVQTCPKGCLTMAPTGLVIDRERCEACGRCVDACPSGAREMLGKVVSVDEVLDELVKDRAYYEASGGGVTLSGGEPTFQSDFAEELLCELKTLGISTALDTCGFCQARSLKRLLRYTDLVLFDLKLFDPSEHHRFTGVSNERILANLSYIKDALQHPGSHSTLWIRTPLIPGATATEANLTAIGGFLAEQMDGLIARWELCAFNNLCRDQYTRLGLPWTYAQTPLLTPEDLAGCEGIARRSGFPPDRINVTGATRYTGSK